MSLQRSLAIAALSLFVAIAPSCRRRGPQGPIGPAGPVDDAVLPAPDDLRLQSHPGGPPHYVLRWSMPTPNTAIGMFVVYRSALPMPFADPSAIVAVVGGAAREAEIELAADAGDAHLRVAAVSETGVAGGLSPEFVVDTTARITVDADVVPGTADLVTMLPGDGGAPVNLSQLPGSVPFGLPAVLSPDGRHAAYWTARLFVRALDGSDGAIDVTGTMVAGGTVWAAAWSPDGRRIAFVADKDSLDHTELYVATLGAAGEPVKVSGTMVGGFPVAQIARGGQRSQPLMAWSADNHRIAYIASQRDEIVYEAMVATADGSSPPIAVAGATPRDAAAVAWSPEGGRLAIAGDVDGSGEILLYVTTGATGAANVPVASSGLGSGALPLDFAWAPDGTRLAFRDDRRPGAAVDLWVADPTGTGTPVPLWPTPLPNVDIIDWAWSPDGTEIAVLGDLLVDGQVELFVAPATGGVNPAKVSGTLVQGGDVIHMQWARDGQQLAFTATKDFAFVSGLYVTTPGVVGEPIRVSNAFDQVREFAWSTEGDRLGYIHDDNDGPPVLFVTGRRGGALPFRRLSTSILRNLRWSQLGDAVR